MSLFTLILVSAIPSSQWQLLGHMGIVSDILVLDESVICATTGGVAFASVSGGVITWDSTWTYPGELSHANCRCATSTADGSIWIGTWGGGIDVYQPDGDFVHFGQLEGLPISQQVSAILPDTAIFAGTSEGLSIMDLGYFQTWTELNTGGGLTDDIVTCLASSDSGLFVGTEDGVSMLRPGGDPGDPDTWVAFPGMNGMRLRELTWCSDTLWAAVDDGVFFLPPGSDTWARDTFFPFTEALCIASNGTDLVAGSGWQSVVRENGNWKGRAVWGGQDVRSVAFGPGGLICAGLTSELDTDDMGRGLGVRFNEYYTVSAPPGVPACDIRSVTIDDRGICWVTTEHAGASAFVGGEWVSYTPVISYEHQVFESESQPGGSVFIGPYAHGMNWLDNAGTPETEDDSVLAFDDENSGLLNNQVISMHRGPTGETWFGQYPVSESEASGVTRLEWVPGDITTASWVSWTPADGLPSGLVHAVSGLSGGSAWVGTEAGLVRVGPGEGEISQVLDASDGLPSDIVRALVATRTGRLFAGTASGLAIIEPGAFSAGEVEEVEGAVSAMSEDNTGAVWVSTGEALYRVLNDGGVEEYNRLNCPILTNVVYDIACDRNLGLLYIVTDHGMWRVDLGEGLEGDGESACIFPNPFLPGSGDVLGVAGIADLPTGIRVFDLTGALVYQFASPDRDGIAWDGSDSDGEPVPSGIYVVEITQDGYSDTVGLALVR